MLPRLLAHQAIGALAANGQIKWRDQPASLDVIEHEGNVGHAHAATCARGLAGVAGAFEYHSHAGVDRVDSGEGTPNVPDLNMGLREEQRVMAQVAGMPELRFRLEQGRCAYRREHAME